MTARLQSQRSEFAAWQSGFRYDHADRESWWHPWPNLVIAACQRGAVVRRARIISEPTSVYIRFEYDITFRNIAAGEDCQRTRQHPCRRT